MNKNALIYSVLLLFLIPFVHADAAIPLLFIGFPAMLIALIPVILVECLVIMNVLGVRFVKTLWPSSLANLASTVIGVPLSQLLLFGWCLATDWLFSLTGFRFGEDAVSSILFGISCPVMIANDAYFIFAAIITSLIIAFFVSVFSEYFVLKFFFKEHLHKLKKAVWIANAVSYALLLLTFLAMTLIKTG